MDFINKLTSDNQKGEEQRPQQQEEGKSSFFDKLHGMAGGGPESEKKEDALDKAIDYVQEKFLGAGDQSNESAAEQAKDNMIADAIRDQYKKHTNKEFPIADKE